MNKDSPTIFKTRYKVIRSFEQPRNTGTALPSPVECSTWLRTFNQRCDVLRDTSARVREFRVSVSSWLTCLIQHLAPAHSLTAAIDQNLGTS